MHICPYLLRDSYLDIIWTTITIDQPFSRIDSPTLRSQPIASDTEYGALFSSSTAHPRTVHLIWLYTLRPRKDKAAVIQFLDVEGRASRNVCDNFDVSRGSNQLRKRQAFQWNCGSSKQRDVALEGAISRRKTPFEAWIHTCDSHVHLPVQQTRTRHLLRHPCAARRKDNNQGLYPTEVSYMNFFCGLWHQNMLLAKRIRSFATVISVLYCTCIVETHRMFKL